MKTVIANKQSIYCYNIAAIINDEILIEQLKIFLLKNNYNQLYISLNLSLLDDPKLSSFISLLNTFNIRTEAVCGTVSWGNPVGLTSMTTMINKIITYNQNKATNMQLGSVHLDVEPWIGTGEDYSWIDPLLDAYENAKILLQNSGLKLSVAVSGVKIRNASLEQRQRLINIVDCIVLMQYQNTLAQTVSRTLEFTNNINIHPNKEIMIAIRSIDFIDDTNTCLSFIETGLKFLTGYSGITLYDYASEFIKTK